MAKLDPRFTFESFVVGPANRLASAAARRAAERPGVSYNPLFIYAAAGLGKTHILGAIAHHVGKVSPGKKVGYQPAQDFLRDFVQATGDKSPAGIRTRYKILDFLLLDDVQLLTTQADVQDLLLLTLDTLIEDGKQLVLASDRPPVEIDGLGALLRSRFEGGLLVKIGAPEYETRVAIIQEWLEARLQVMAPGVAEAIGRFPFKAVTDLHTALARVLEIQDRDNRLITPEEAGAIVERGEGVDLGFINSELGQFLDELSDSVAAKVQAQEAPWRKALRELAEEVEVEGFRADRLRHRIESDAPPRGLETILEEFRATVQRLKEIGAELQVEGNPWPEAAHGVLKDPERLDEAEALLASARERSRPFPKVPPGPTLKEMGGELPQLVIRAADQLVGTDRPEYNPLYVWSSDGAAALALLQAAARTRLKKEGGSKVAQTSASRFAQEFIQSLTAGTAGAWRERWWSADLVLVDRAQDLSLTERAQEEFVHLFEALTRRRARVMIAADRPPNNISPLDDRLRAQLEGGLVIEIDVKATDLSSSLQETLEEAAAEEEPIVEKVRGIADEDREWIMSFQPGRTAGGARSRGSGGKEEEEFLEALEAGADLDSAVDPWTPSPERVVWEWPNLADRLAEEPD
jgi:chromosomal replication initiation ATPase DnaA